MALRRVFAPHQQGLHDGEFLSGRRSFHGGSDGNGHGANETLVGGCRGAKVEQLREREGEV